MTERRKDENTETQKDGNTERHKDGKADFFCEMQKDLRS